MESVRANNCQSLFASSTPTSTGTFNRHPEPLDFEIITIKIEALGSYVIVMSCVRGMWRVYSPDTQGRVAPEGEGLCTSHIPTSHDIIDLCHVFSTV